MIDKKEEVDVLEKVQRDSARVVAFTSLVMSALLVIVVGVGGTVAYRLYQQLRAGHDSTCKFYKDAGNIPVIISGPVPTSKVGVQIIVDARNSYRERGCGTLSPPSPELVTLEIRYGIPVS